MYKNKHFWRMPIWLSALQVVREILSLFRVTKLSFSNWFQSKVWLRGTRHHPNFCRWSTPGEEKLGKLFYLFIFLAEITLFMTDYILIYWSNKAWMEPLGNMKQLSLSRYRSNTSITVKLIFLSILNISVYLLYKHFRTILKKTAN